jgi:hypothetical protein
MLVARRSQVLQSLVFLMTLVVLQIVDFATRGNDIETDDTLQYNADYCESQGSLNEIVFRMANHSSPKGSASYNKLKQILYKAHSFEIHPMNRIFEDVVKNIAAMLKGFGLQQVVTNSNLSNILHVESSETSWRQVNGKNTSPRIILQTEQLIAKGKQYFSYLQECHRLTTCIIWDFSDFNYDWAVKQGISDSFVLFPIMIQSRLYQRQRTPLIKPLASRTLDVAFFGLMTKRRIMLKEECLQRNWTIQFDRTRQQLLMVDSYHNAKVCLVAHSYNKMSGGEYHRLSEVAIMGCIPVVEDFSDTIAIEDYRRCGGVVFASYESLIEAGSNVLKEVNNFERDTKKYVEWWARGINWEALLKRMFDESIGSF